jgi:acetyl esterase/lipase
VVVCPGGAFHIHSIDTEGYEVAEYLAARGIVAFTLEYRLATTPAADDDVNRFITDVFLGVEDLPALVAEHEPKALAEGIRAVEIVRERAEEWGVDATKIGILGFSAGGYVAAGAALCGQGAGRPDFCGAIYAARWTEPVVPGDAGPLFVAMSADDQIGRPVIDTGFALHSAWRAARRPVELHVYQGGGHGYGTRRQGTTSDAWLEQFHTWLTFNVDTGAIGR